MLKRIIRKIRRLLFCKLFPCGFQTQGTANPITLKTLFIQKVLGFNRYAYWPTHHSSVISNPRNILIGIGTSPGMSPGCYIQGIGKVYIGNYSIIAPNVGIVSANHSVYNHKEHIIGQVIIGDYCWIGMNSVVLPNVTLGDFTVVAAGSVVNKSFPEGYCVIAGNPAKVIKTLDKEKCVRHNDKYEYIGYYKADKFEQFRKNKLNV